MPPRGTVSPCAPRHPLAIRPPTRGETSRAKTGLAQPAGALKRAPEKENRKLTKKSKPKFQSNGRPAGPPRAKSDDPTAVHFEIRISNFGELFSLPSGPAIETALGAPFEAPAVPTDHFRLILPVTPFERNPPPRPNPHVSPSDWPRGGTKAGEFTPRGHPERF
ncbi:hypothetical protein NL676_028928 [Syzygium grande]|nr:hypothetical protein NL676_028928 [Syzygium grande]